MIEVEEPGEATGSRINQRMTARPVSGLWRAAPLFLYCVLSVLFFGRGLIGHFSSFHLGTGGDPPLMMWYLVWWPHAISNRLNPFLTHAFWAPSGFNITWSSSIPFVSLLTTPLTATLGPVAALNVVCLLSLPLAAWCAFLLCRYVSGNYWTSILGGYIFGFCPFMLGVLSFARLHLLTVFLVPLILYIGVRRFQGQLTALRSGALLAVLLIVEFLSSVEIFTTTALLGGIALVLAWLLNPGEVRRHLFRVMMAFSGAYIFALFAVSPYLYYFFFGDRPYYGPMWREWILSADLLNLLIPTPINELGRFASFSAVSYKFNYGFSAEAVAYLSPPLMIITGFYARRHWREPLGKLLVDLLVSRLVNGSNVGK